MSSHRPDSSLTPFGSAGLAVALVLGWSLFDLLVFATSGDPSAAVKILPGALAAAALAGLIGGLLAAHRAAPLLLTLLAGIATGLTGLPTKYLSLEHNWLVRTVFLLLAIFVVASWLERRWSLGLARLGVSLGYLGAMGLALARHVPARDAWWFGAAAAAVLLGVGFQRRALWRRGATIGALAIALAMASTTVNRIQGSMRDDLPPPEKRASGPNLLLIVMDTVRADHLSCYGHERETTPVLDALASSVATRFTRARSTSSWTLPSHASLMTGLYPAEHAATSTRGKADELTARRNAWPCQPVDTEVPMIAEQLRERGYRTGAAVGNGFNLRHQLGFGRGFEYYDDRYGAFTDGHFALCQLVDVHRSLGRLAYRDAEMVADSALAWLRSVGPDEPFFLFVNFMDPHAPYYPHASVRDAFSDQQPRNPQKPEEADVPLLYDREILFVDGQIGRILDGLRARGAFDDTMIVVTSDHGEGLGEHGNWLHSWTLYEELLHVPLLVKAPGQSSSQVDDTPLTLVDVHDRLAATLSIAPAARSAPFEPIAEWYRGIWQNAEQQARLEQAMAQPLDRDLIAWLEGEVKLIVGSNGSVEAYDLEADPEEKAPLELSEEQRAAAVERANRWWAEHPPGVVVEEVLGAEDAKRLKVLGYFGGDE